MKNNLLIWLFIIFIKNEFTSGLESNKAEKHDLKPFNRSPNDAKAIKLDCDKFENCTSCVSSSHPCDWCIGSNRCFDNAERNCNKDVLISFRSHQHSPSSCPRIQTSNLDSNEILVPIGTKKSISARININQSALLMQVRYQCHFEIEGHQIKVNARLIDNIVYCDVVEFQYTSNTPKLTVPFKITWGDFNELDNPENLHIVIYRCHQLAFNEGACSLLPKKFGCAWSTASNSCELRSQKQSKRRIFKRATSCNELTTCTGCVTSELACSWCIDAHRCTEDSCHNDILISGVNRTGLSHRAGPSFCPKFSATDGENKIFIPAGTEKSIRVKASIIGDFIVQTRFTCQFLIEGKVQTRNAQLLGDTIYCDPLNFQYSTQSPNVTVPFAVIWGGSKNLENADNMEIVVYRCSEMATNSENCSTLPEKYACSWCSSSNACELENQCH